MALLILMAAIASFVSEKVSPDITALLAILALMLTGVLTPEEAFSGFSHPATISVAAVLVLSAAIERTGSLSFLARRVLMPLGKSEILLTGVLMLVIGFISAFINNTAAVAIFIPLVLEVCRRTNLSPGRILMPMSFTATMGGMCTLIGTSTNLVAHELAVRHGLPGFSMWELGKIGLPMTLLGFTYMLVVGRLFLPRSQSADLMTQTLGGKYLAEVLVLHRSTWVGREVRPEHLMRDFELELLKVERKGQALVMGQPGPRYEEGDSLQVRGSLNQILTLARQEGLALHRPNEPVPWLSAAPKIVVLGEKTPDALEEARHNPLAEVVVLTHSGLIGRTLKETRFAERYDAVVLALRRRGEAAEGRPSLTPLQAGDVLVVEGKPEALAALADTQGFLVIGNPVRPEERPGRVLITVLTMVAVIAVVSFGWLPIVTAATAGCVILMLSRCLRPREAYEAIDLSIVFLLAGALALGTSLQKTGITSLVAQGLGYLHDYTSPMFILAACMITAVMLSEFMSNSGTAALLIPIAIELAGQMHVNPMSLIAAVTFGSSAAFAMPIGYQTSLMIYGPGGYRMKDFIRMGLVLDVLLLLLALWLIPRHWPLTLP